MTDLVDIKNLNIRFTGERTVHAVNDLTLSLREGEVLGLLGESGSGKSVTLRALVRLLPRNADADLRQREGAGAGRPCDGRRGAVGVPRPDRLDDLSGAGAGARPGLHHRRQIAETVMRHEGKSEREATARALEMLEVVRIPSAKRRLRFLSARNVRRHAPARHDRAGAGLQAENPAGRRADHRARRHRADSRSCSCLRELQREFGMSVIFVTHDIGVAIESARRIAVMYAGQTVEQGTLREIVRSPVHPYARGLLASTTHGAKRGQRLETIPGTPPSLDRAPTSCSFAPRCSFVQPRCTGQLPPNVEIASGRTARCILAEPATAVPTA